MRRIALCYVRKSLVKQGTIDPASPDVQRRQLTSWCELNSLTPEWHEDAEGHQSGMRADRSGWQAVRARLRDPDVAVLAVTAWDRAARSVRELLDVTDACQSAGVRFVATGDNIDTRTADGRLQLTILAGVAEHYSRRVGEWRAASIDALRRNRGRHYGYAPFGTQRVARDGDLVLVPSEAQQPNGTDHECLTLLYQLFTHERLSYHQIARRLNGDGWRYRDRHKLLRAWTPEDVRRAVKGHWIYAGNVVIGQSDRTGPFEVIPGSHDPILPAILTTAAGFRVKQFRARGPLPHPPRKYPLTGLVVCGLCGARYRARGPGRYGAADRCEQGGAHSILSEALEADTRAFLASLRYPGDVMTVRDQAVVSALLEDDAGDDQVVEERARAAIDRLIDLYTSGAISKDEFTRRRTEYEAVLPKRPDKPASTSPILIEVGAVIKRVPDNVLRDIAAMMLDRIEIWPDGPRFVLKTPFDTWRP